MKKGLQHLLTLALLIIVVAGVSQQGVLANNHEDTGFSFNWANGQYRYTEARPKMDDSNCYMYVVGGKTSFTAWAEGKVTSSTYADLSHGYHYTMYVGTIKYMRNWVWEEGYVNTSGTRTARLVGYKSILSGKASGWWSPDSV